MGGVLKGLLKIERDVPILMVLGSLFLHLGTTNANGLDCNCLVC